MQLAIEAYQKAVDINPLYWYNHNSLAIALATTGDNDKALASFRKVTELSPDWAPGYNNIGAVYFQMGKWKEAVAAYQQSISRDKNADAYMNLGLAYYYLGLYSESADTLEKARQIEPNRDDIAADLGDAYRQLGKRDQATANYDAAIRLALKAFQVNSRNARNLGGLALYYAKKGDLGKAQEFIARARAIDAKDNVLIYNEALIQALAGKSADALKSLKEAFQKGYPPEVAHSEPELTALRSAPEFERLMAEFSRKAK